MAKAMRQYIVNHVYQHFIDYTRHHHKHLLYITNLHMRTHAYVYLWMCS